MDAIEPKFRPMYEKICVGNKRSDAQHVFFEGMLLENGLGEDMLASGTSIFAYQWHHRPRPAMVWKLVMGTS
jgi:salicylate hydroxylase